MLNTPNNYVPFILSLCFRKRIHDSFDAFFKFSSWKHYLVRTAIAFYTYIHASSQNFPCSASARVLFFKFNNISNFKFKYQNIVSFRRGRFFNYIIFETLITHIFFVETSPICYLASPTRIYKACKQLHLKGLFIIHKFRMPLYT